MNMHFNKLALLFLTVLLLIGAGWMWHISVDQVEEVDVPETAEVIERYYAPLVPMQIGETEVRASVASTATELRYGLSDTPILPEGIVKLFVFNKAEQWGIWMKDMNYALDVIWVSEGGEVVHIAPSVHPDTYPMSFEPDEPALYVIEANAGFASQHGIEVGATVTLPSR